MCQLSWDGQVVPPAFGKGKAMQVGKVGQVYKGMIWAEPQVKEDTKGLRRWVEDRWEHLGKAILHLVSHHGPWEIT